jgi:hypothetical protein
MYVNYRKRSNAHARRTYIRMEHNLLYDIYFYFCGNWLFFGTTSIDCPPIYRPTIYQPTIYRPPIYRPTIYQPTDISTPNISTDDISTNLLAEFLQYRPLQLISDDFLRFFYDFYDFLRQVILGLFDPNFNPKNRPEVNIFAKKSAKTAHKNCGRCCKIRPINWSINGGLML